jgi:hypothetical protein
MSNGWADDFITFLVIPTGATTGARITINVDQNGAILVYDENGVLIGAWSGSAGTDPSTHTAYPAGFSVFNDIAGQSAGSVQILSNSVNNSPVIELVGKPGVSLNPAAIFVDYHATGPNAPFELLGITGPAAPAGEDADSSYVYMELVSGGTDADGAAGALGFGNSLGIQNVLVWTLYGVNIIGQFPGGGYEGRVVMTDQVVVKDTSPSGILHFGQASVTVSGSSGQATWAHGAAFTPASASITPQAGFWQYSINAPFGTDGFTDTDGQIIVRDQSGTLVPNGGGVDFSYIVWQ